MSLTARDRKALVWGGGGVALILFTGYVLTPLLRYWSDQHDLLQTRTATVATLRDKLANQDTLRTRRDAVAMRLGSLRVLHPPTPTPTATEEEENRKPGPPPGDAKPAATLDGPASAVPGAETPAPPIETAPGNQPSAAGPTPGPPAPAAGPTPGPPNPAAGPAPGPPDPAAPPKTPPVEASSLATYIEKHAMAAQIKIKRIAPKKNTTGKKQTTYFEPVTLQVSFECQITGLLALLQRLEHGELFTRIDQLDITRDVKKGDLLTASLDVSSYEPRRATP